MITKRCPKCRSTRIRRGYTPDVLPMRIIGYRELLCDGCNLRFKGFVLPGTLPRSGHTKKKERKEKTPENPAPASRAAEPSTSHSGKRCPACGGERTHRSHRRGITERLASTL